MSEGSVLRVAANRLDFEYRRVASRHKGGDTYAAIHRSGQLTALAQTAAELRALAERCDAGAAWPTQRETEAMRVMRIEAERDESEGRDG